MQRMSLVCVFLFLIALVTTGTAADTFEYQGVTLVPLSMPESPAVTHAVHYAPTETTDYSPLTVAASTPAHYSSPTADNPATTVYYSPAATVTSPASGPCVPASAASPCTPCTVGRPVVTCRPVVETARMPRNYYVGRGMIGQPVVYVPGQPVRNALRWFFP